MNPNLIEKLRAYIELTKTNVSGGGDRTRTCIAFRPAVFKTAALPLCDPSAGWVS